ncbi:MAG: Holliday junction branch migration protein RuvA [Clostridiaceae bacterium]|nr:Holliday junction branch migration protein RuvA [Clostridiaceae bacterium]
MFSYIKGTLVQKNEDSIIVENSGIGYKIFCPQLMQEKIGKLNEPVCVYTYYYVREDTAALYGFPGSAEHDLFVLLLQVSGIGPKVAVSLSGTIPPSEFALAVITGDTTRLTQVKGVGKKVAERIFLELKDKLKGFAQDIEGIDSSRTVAGVPEGTDTSSVIHEAASALMFLGYSSSQAVKVTRDAYEDGINTEELIRKALRML